MAIDEKLPCCELTSTDDTNRKEEIYVCPSPWTVDTMFEPVVRTFGPINNDPLFIYKLLTVVVIVSRSISDDSVIYAVDIWPETFSDEKLPCCELTSTDDTNSKDEIYLCPSPWTVETSEKLETYWDDPSPWTVEASEKDETYFVNLVVIIELIASAPAVPPPITFSPRNNDPLFIYKLLSSLVVVSRSISDDSVIYAVDICPETFSDEKLPCCELTSSDDTNSKDEVYLCPSP